MFKGPGKIVQDNKSSSYPVFELTGVNCIWVETPKSQLKQPTFILKYKNNTNNMYGIHVCFILFCPKPCITKIVKWDFFGIVIMEKK